jgi:hypothetical protein
MSHGRGVSSHTIDFLIRKAHGFVTEEFATPRERNETIRRH